MLLSSLTAIEKRNFIVDVLRNGYTDSDIIHNRWSALYNTYDEYFGCDIRAEHDEYIRNNKKVSRIQFLEQTNRLDAILNIAYSLYPIEFTKQILRRMENGEQ